MALTPAPKYQVRRATLDDLGALLALWQSMGFPVEDLARRVTEFQVVVQSNGQLIGAIGLQMSARHGRLHSEAFTDFALADQVRPLLWDRLHAVAANHGLVRLWTQEQAPFYSHCGLAKADLETLSKLPPAWRGASPTWLTLKLKEDLEEAMSLDKEFALFMESEKQRTERALHQARVLKFIAILVVLGVLGLMIAGAVYVLQRSPQLLHH